MLLILPLQKGFAQGSLTPSGAPAPTMKSLDQIEARTPISALPFTISSPGSYYLTKSLNVTTGNGITINVSRVTVDLSGFTISSTASSATGTGIALASGLADITIFNGHIKGGVTYSGGTYSGPGFANGIEYSGNAPVNVRVTGVSVSACLSDGINLSANAFALVESCIVYTVGGNGIVAANVSHSVANQCGNVGIFAPTVSDCYAQSTGSSDAISATNAHNCEAQNTGSGIGLSAYTANNCYGSSAGGFGLVVDTATNCEGISGGGGSMAGIGARMALNCYAINTGNGDSLAATTATNCQGFSGGAGRGVSASEVNNCQGYSNTGTGVNAIVATNSFGSGGNIGLEANSATSCQGSSTSGTGLSAFYIAIGCYGNSSGGTGLSAYIANSSYGTSGGTPESINYKYNMP